MFDWLIENPTPVYLLLGVAAVGLVAAFWFTRKRHWLIGLAVAAVLALAVFLLSFFVVTDGKQILNAITEMRAAVQRRDTDGIVKHLARDFQLQGHDRNRFRSSVEQVFKNGIVDDVEVWEFDEMKVDRPAKQASLAFKAKPKKAGREVSETGVYLVRAAFVLEDDGQWRMKTFQVFNPFVETNTPLQVPLP